MSAATRVRDEYQTFLDENSITGDIATSMRALVRRLDEAIAEEGEDIELGAILRKILLASDYSDQRAVYAFTRGDQLVLDGRVVLTEVELAAVRPLLEEALAPLTDEQAAEAGRLMGPGSDRPITPAGFPKGDDLPGPALAGLLQRAPDPSGWRAGMDEDDYRELADWLCSQGVKMPARDPARP